MFSGRSLGNASTYVCGSGDLAKACMHTVGFPDTWHSSVQYVKITKIALLLPHASSPRPLLPADVAPLVPSRQVFHV